MTDAETDPPQQPAAHGKPDPAPRSVDSRDLLQGAKELLIRHAGEIYRLRLTRNGKLILHK